MSNVGSGIQKVKKSEAVRRGKRGIFHIIFGRMGIVIVLLAVQVYFLYSLFSWVREAVFYGYWAHTILTMVMSFVIINSKQRPEIKTAWLLPVILVPVFGALFFLFVQAQPGRIAIKAAYRGQIEKTAVLLRQQEHVMRALRKEDPQMAGLAHYVSEYGHFPVYQNSTAVFYPSGEAQFDEMKRELWAARHFIFLEYFIIQDGIFWGTILDILKSKVLQGVEVRVMYDGTCMLNLLPYHYPRELEKCGIHCHVFAPIRPALSTHQNNRDHRKILVIDGHTAFTGGINLADEYINKTKRFGYWKDTACMVRGEAVQSFTMMFLHMWNLSRGRQEAEDRDYARYAQVPLEMIRPYPGFVLPYGDGPAQTELTAENIYIYMLQSAERYVHMMTPYLVIDNEVKQAMIFAAKRGIDVKMILPHIPDKKAVFALTRSYYRELTEAGVGIYEFTPGFVHAKEFVSDDTKAVVGSINLDYRSLYLHYECGCLFYQMPVVADIEQDFEQTLRKCERVTPAWLSRQNKGEKLIGSVMKLIAPLL